MRETLRPLPPAYVRGDYSDSLTPLAVEQPRDDDLQPDEPPPTYSRTDPLQPRPRPRAEFREAARLVRDIRTASEEVDRDLLHDFNQGTTPAVLHDIDENEVSEETRRVIRAFFAPERDQRRPPTPPQRLTLNNDIDAIEAIGSPPRDLEAGGSLPKHDPPPPADEAANTDVEATRSSSWQPTRRRKRKQWWCCACCQCGVVFWNFVLFWVVVLSICAGVAWSEVNKGH
jgi:hypothetical protein